MNKKELVQLVSDEADMSIKDAEKFISAFTEVVTSELGSGGAVTLAGFGSLDVKHRAERTGRHPKTGEPLKIPSANVPKFKAGKHFKDAITGVPS
ncbi:HU family DNA-binding protein [Marinomonas algarum]|uniref:HU family DNA-binding protein n=1 Tax=Marinomonas algarum TaxID=2883105 RepID=A0A9X1INL3_9GAMM|nr:HU family DNA-binding protein [Marinomonas algarum]MCB5162622.1 HU family DNA-binding protein [Marinomonas algarum]